MILDMLISSPESEKTRLRFSSSHVSFLNQVKQVATDTAATIEATNLLFRKKNRDEKLQRFAEEFALALQETKLLTEAEFEYSLFFHSICLFPFHSSLLYLFFLASCFFEQIHEIFYFFRKLKQQHPEIEYTKCQAEGIVSEYKHFEGLLLC
jgi:hypothetical protein